MKVIPETCCAHIFISTILLVKVVPLQKATPSTVKKWPFDLSWRRQFSSSLWSEHYKVKKFWI